MKPRHRLGLVLLFLGICAGALVTQRVLAARRLQAPPAALYAVVHQEIEAVLASDFTRAYEQVSTGVQERFNVETFAEHLRGNYPDARRIERVEFGRVAHNGLQAVVQVFFFLPGGDIVPCIYTLVNEDSVWKIDAAHMQKRWPSNRRLGGLRS